MRTTIWQLPQSLLGFAIIHFSNCMHYAHRKQCIVFCLLFLLLVVCLVLLVVFCGCALCSFAVLVCVCAVCAVFCVVLLWLVLLCVCKNEGTCFIMTYCLMMFLLFLWLTQQFPLPAVLSQQCFFLKVRCNLTMVCCNLTMVLRLR